MKTDAKQAGGAKKKKKREAPAWLAKTGRFIKKHRQWFVAAALFLLCLVVFYVYWGLQVAAAREKSQGIYLNDVQQAETPALENGQLLSQRFTTAAPFHAIGLAAQYEGERPPWTEGGVDVAAYSHLEVRVYGQDGQLLGSAMGLPAESAPGTYAMFVFPETIEAEGGAYRLEVEARFTGEGDGCRFAKSEAAPEGWALALNGGDEDGALCLLLASGQVGGFITGYYWLFAVLGSVLAAGVYLLAARGKMALHRLVVLCIIGLGVLFCMVLPPYAAPDEQFHINQTFSISSFIMGQTPYREEWGTSVRRAGDVNAALQDEVTTVYSWQAMADGLLEGGAENTPVVYPDEGVDGYRLLYWPAALAITLCRLVGLGFVPALLAGRLVNLVLFALLAGLAIKMTPRGKSAFAVVALLPITLHLAASFNRDGLTIGLYMLLTALCLHYALEKPTFTEKDMLVLALLAVVAGPSKIVYAPMLLLCFFIPGKKFRWRGRALGRRWSLLIKCAVVLVGCWSLASTIATWLSGLYYSLFVDPGETIAAAAAAEAAGEVAEVWEPPPPDEYLFGPWDFFRRPGVMVWLILRTLFTKGLSYIQAMVGGSLGYNSLELSWGFVLVFLVLLMLAAIPEPEEKALKPGIRLSGGAIILAVGGLIVLGCIVWTPMSYDTIYGIQGRYFLPMLPLALCCLGRPKGMLQKVKNSSRTLVAATSISCVFALLNAFLLVLER